MWKPSRARMSPQQQQQRRSDERAKTRPGLATLTTRAARIVGVVRRGGGDDDGDGGGGVEVGVGADADARRGLLS